MKTLWKSMEAGLKSSQGDTNWKIGEWQEAEGQIKTCKNGFHASELIVDAIRYVPCEILARVEVNGKHDDEHDKQAWQKMRIVDAWVWKKEHSVKLAIFAAEQVLHIFEKEYPKDDRPRKAIEAAKNWLNNKTALAPYDAADAAYDAADAAYAAADAADAAYAAARAAAHAASAAHDAARAAHAARAAADAADAAHAAHAARAAADAADDAARAAAYAASYADAAADAADDAARAAAYAADDADDAVKNDCEKYILTEILPTLKLYRPAMTPDNITYLRDDEIFVFGSNKEGNHAGGAARTAVDLFRAIEGQGEGLHGQSYAIPTMGTDKEMKDAIKRFVKYAKETPYAYYYVTKIGTGIAGRSPSKVQSMFPKRLPKNIIMPEWEDNHDSK